MAKLIKRLLLAAGVAAVLSLLWLGYEAHAVYTNLNAIYRAAPRLAVEPKATPGSFLGRHRVTILLLGSDNDQKFQQLYPLTQTMILVTIDPVHDKVGMLSIPRDFWVPIPGYGMGKIDTASEHGGFSLARATVENLFHITIDYYAWVGLAGFSHVVDDFGGVTIDVNHPVLDDFYPDDQGSGNPYAYTRIFIPPGWHHLSGRQALEYVRSRHGDAVGDFGRSQRQQQILLQLRALAGGWNLLLKIPQLSHDLSSMVRTDIGFDKLLDVARLSRAIGPRAITRVVLSAPTYCQYGTSDDGQSILVPNWQAILPVTRKLFAPIQSAPRPDSKPVAVATATAGTAPTPAPVARPRATPMPTATPLAQPTGLLPGKVIYATGGTFDEMDRSGHVTDIMPSWMTAAAMPAIAPDGRNLAFVRWSAEASDIGTYDLRTHAAPTQITKDLSPDPTFISNSLWAAWPSWSADGKTLLFASDAYKLQAAANESRMLDLAIYRISRDGSNLQQLTTPASGAGGDTDPQFRGRTSEFLYDHWAYTWHGGVAVGQPHSQLMIRNADNPHASWTLTPPSDQIVQPALDRSGTHVAYIHSGSVSSTLITGRIVDSRRGPVLRDRRVVARGKIAQPAFTPDGRWVSYLQADGSGFSLYLVPVRGGQAFKVAAAGSGLDATSRPVWVQ